MDQHNDACDNRKGDDADDMQKFSASPTAATSSVINSDGHDQQHNAVIIDKPKSDDAVAKKQNRSLSPAATTSVVIDLVDFDQQQHDASNKPNSDDFVAKKISASTSSPMMINVDDEASRSNDETYVLLTKPTQKPRIASHSTTTVGERANTFLEEQTLIKRKREVQELHDSRGVLPQQQKFPALVVQQQQPSSSFLSEGASAFLERQKSKRAKQTKT